MIKTNSIILSVLFVLASFTLKAQKNVTVAWGPTYKVDGSIDAIIGEDKTGFYALRTKGKLRKQDLFIERYDKKMNLKFSEELVIPKKGKKPLDYEGIFYVKGQLILLASSTDKKAGRSYAFAYPISKQGKVGTKFKKLDEINMSGRRTGSFDFVLSKDSTKILVYHNNPYEKYNNEEFSYKVYDDALNLVWEKEVQLPYKDRYFSIEDYIVDNEGNVFMRAEIYPDRQKGEKASKEYQADKFVVLSYNHKKDKISQFEVKLSGKWIRSMSYDINEHTKEVAVGGFYADDRKMAIKGVFYLAMDIETGEIKTTSKKEFDKGFMADMIGERKAEKGKGLTSFVFDHFLVKKDGGAYLLAEKYYVTVHTYTDANGNTHTKYTYHYDDIIVVSVGKTGDIDWVRKVPKKSGASSGYYLSYGISHNKEKDNLNLFFNDNPKNIEYMKDHPNKAKSVGSLKKSMAMLVTFNEEGNMKRVPMFSAKDIEKIILRPVISIMTSDTEVITFGQKGSKYKLGKFTFK